MQSAGACPDDGDHFFAKIFIGLLKQPNHSSLIAAAKTLAFDGLFDVLESELFHGLRIPQTPLEG